MPFKFNIDKLIKTPNSIVHKLPLPIKFFLGGNTHNVSKISDYWIWLDILISTFCGIALLEGLFKSSNIFTDHHNAPIIIASYGATAILCFNTISVPLAQPRNILFGHFFSALIGVCISKLFQLSQTGLDNIWAGGALSVGVASVLMSILNCVHPPAGASALLPCVDEGIRKMSWWYLPVHLVSSILIICVSLIVDNVLRKYPNFWWTGLKRKSLEIAVKPATVYESEEKKIVITEGQISVPKNILVDGDVEALQSLHHKLFPENVR